MNALAEKMLKDTKKRLGDAWDDLEHGTQWEIQETLEDLAGLLARAATGEDVDQETSEVRATIANWEWVGASRVRSVVAEVVSDAAKFLAALAAAFVKGLL